MKPIFAVLAAVAALSFASAPAQAQSFRELMEDIGLQKRKQEKMDFSERAPLVLPPSLEALPPPEDTTAIAGVNPQWPTDPDALAAAQEAEEEKVPQHMRRKYNPHAAQEIYEIRAKDRERTTATSNATPYETIFDRDQKLSPAELKKVRDSRANQPAQAYVEPERKRLTDPPEGYRVPSPAQPYGQPDEKKKKEGGGWFSKVNPFD
jgi:hypothetical protein